MTSMFYEARRFNQPLGGWNVGKVREMSNMFEGAEAFNQPLNQWDVSSVENMTCMFMSMDAFNQPLSQWNTENVTNMQSMFMSCQAFNQSLEDWDIGNVAHGVESGGMHNMFDHADAFQANTEGYARPIWTTDYSNKEGLSAAHKNEWQLWFLQRKRVKGFKIVAAGEQVHADREKIDGTAAGVAVGAKAQVLTTRELVDGILQFVPGH
jgi:surface protein